MTTSASAAAASPRAVAGPGRRATGSPLRRTSEIVLVVGTVLAVGAAFGPTWLVRIGIGIALLAAVVACLFAWRELFWARRAHAKDVLQVSQQHGQALREERTRNAAVVDTLTQRATEAGVAVDRHRTVIEGQRTVIVTLRSEVAGLHAEQAGLKTQLAQRDTTITSLQQTIGAREAELATLRDTVDEADAGPAVRHLPLRALVEHGSTGNPVPDADDLWSDGSHPTVVDLRMVDTAMILPNYEVDRRFA